MCIYDDKGIAPLDVIGAFSGGIEAFDSLRESTCWNDQGCSGLCFMDAPSLMELVAHRTETSQISDLWIPGFEGR